MLKVVVSVLVWLYFKYLSMKESRKLKEKMDQINEDKRIKDAIKDGNAKEVARIIKFYKEYGGGNGNG